MATKAWFGFGLVYIPVNSYGHVETVSSPNPTTKVWKITKHAKQTLRRTFNLQL